MTMSLIGLVGCSTSPTAPPVKQQHREQVGEHHHHSRTYLPVRTWLFHPEQGDATTLPFRATSVNSVFPW
jgi:hypothetical protein